MDVYLPDCKFFDKEMSKNYAKAEDYFEVAKYAIKEMVRQVGAPVFDKNTGNMLRGVIVRHLILPGHTKDSMEILHYLHTTYENQIYISIMNQFTPVVLQEKYLNLNRCVTEREYQKVIDYAINIGIEQAFIQEGETANESFIPEFDCSFV